MGEQILSRVWWTRSGGVGRKIQDPGGTGSSTEYSDSTEA